MPRGNTNVPDAAVARLSGPFTYDAADPPETPPAAVLVMVSKFADVLTILPCVSVKTPDTFTGTFSVTSLAAPAKLLLIVRLVKFTEAALELMVCAAVPLNSIVPVLPLNAPLLIKFPHILNVAAFTVTLALGSIVRSFSCGVPVLIIGYNASPDGMVMLAVPAGMIPSPQFRQSNQSVLTRPVHKPAVPPPTTVIVPVAFTALHPPVNGML